MEHKPTHLVRFVRKRNRRKFLVADVEDESYFNKVLRMAFKGRFKKPDSLEIGDGVRIIISRLSDNKIVHRCRVYNKSTFQTMVELEEAITSTPI